MISDEKMTEWRDIWQEIIETSRLTLIEDQYCATFYSNFN